MNYTSINNKKRNSLSIASEVSTASQFTDLLPVPKLVFFPGIHEYLSLHPFLSSFRILHHLALNYMSPNFFHTFASGSLDQATPFPDHASCWCFLDFSAGKNLEKL